MTGLHPIRQKLVRSRCWCDTEYVLVSPEDVRAGRTVPCRRKACRRLAALYSTPGR